MRLLCATDLLPRSDFAIERAGALAEELGAELSLLHVVRPLQSERALEEALQSAIGHLRSRCRPPQWCRDFAPGVVVRPGNPARLVADAVQRHRTRLLILGPHRKRGMLEAFEGSIAEKVLRSRLCPVLIVQRAPRSAYRNILFGLDTSAPSVAALNVGAGLVLRPDTVATIAHAYEPRIRGMLGNVAGVERSRKYNDEDERQEAITAIRGMLEVPGRDTSRFDIRASEGLPASEILRAAEAVDADLIVVGTRAAGRVQRALTGSVANQVIRKTLCDVLVVSGDPTALTAEVRGKWSGHGAAEARNAAL